MSFLVFERIAQVFKSVIIEVALPANTMLVVPFQLFNLKCIYFSSLKVMTSGISANIYHQKYSLILYKLVLNFCFYLISDYLYLVHKTSPPENTFP